MFVQDKVKFSGDVAKIASDTHTKYKLRGDKEKKKQRNEQALKEGLGRDTKKENGLMKTQFRLWLSGPDYEKYRAYAAKSKKSK